MPLAVYLRSVVALVGRFPALAGVDLDVAPGEAVLLRGPNGAGKTSLLRVCAGLLAVSSGEASVLGHDLRRDRRSVRRQVGLLSHAGFVYEDLSVEENVRFFALAHGRDGPSVTSALGRLGLAARLRDVPVAHLSAGQRRRVALASLVVRRPALWLLDEPYAGLDAEGREMFDGLAEEAVAGGASVLLASHEGDPAAALAARVVTMSGGRLQADPRREPVHVA